MDIDTLRRLLSENRITEEQFTYLEHIYSVKVFSLYYELKAMLSVGVVLFITGVGMLVYLNIDTISNEMIILLLSALTLACFWFVLDARQPYSNDEVPSPGLSYDYAL